MNNESHLKIIRPFGPSLAIVSIPDFLIKKINNFVDSEISNTKNISSELDAGPLIAQGVIKIKKDEFIDSLIERIHKVEHILLPKIINDICNGNVYLENNKVKFVGMNLKNNKMYLKKYEF